MVLKEIKIKWDSLDKYTKLAVYVIVIGLIIRLAIASLIHISGDGCWHISAIRFIAENYKIPLFEPIGRAYFWPPPFFHIMGVIFYKIIHLISNIKIAEFSVRLLSPIYGTLMLVYTFLLTKKIYNTKIAFFSVLFLSFIPSFLYHSSIPYIEPLVSLLIIMSIYYLLKDKLFFSSILAGLSMLTKFQGLFIYPTLIFILYVKYYNKNERLFFKKAVILTLISGIIGSLGYIRNWLNIGGFFGNIEGSVSSFSLLNIFRPEVYLRLYLGLFGVPSGHLQNLFLFDIPYLKLLLIIWGIGTLIFIFPLFRGLFLFKLKKKTKKKKVLVVWFFCFLVFLFFMITLSGERVFTYIFMRYLIPVFPVIAIMWALGFDRLLKKKAGNLFLILMIGVIIGFIGIEFTKALVVKNMWGQYDDDFKWVREELPKDVVLLVSHDNCFAYNFNRYTITYYGGYDVKSVDDLDKYGVSYVWVNQDFSISSAFEGKKSPYPDDFINEIENFLLVYENSKTKTKIYKKK